MEGKQQILVEMGRPACPAPPKKEGTQPVTKDREQVWAVSMVRDEADMICATIRQLVDEGVDGIIVANNRSVDDTGFLLKALQMTLPIPLIIEEDAEPGTMTVK